MTEMVFMDAGLLWNSLEDTPELLAVCDQLQTPWKNVPGLIPTQALSITPPNLSSVIQKTSLARVYSLRILCKGYNLFCEYIRTLFLPQYSNFSLDIMDKLLLLFSWPLFLSCYITLFWFFSVQLAFLLRDDTFVNALWIAVVPGTSTSSTFQYPCSPQVNPTQSWIVLGKDTESGGLQLLPGAVFAWPWHKFQVSVPAA